MADPSEVPSDTRPGRGAADPALIERLWDERYSEAGQVWSGQPNGALVDEVADLPAGRVLDVGCGEGADAIWLAQHGWDVTALDPSGVAVGRARTAAAAVGVDVTWLHGGLLETALPAAGFDLVIALYPALIRTSDGAPQRALLDAVAAGGTLLFVHHAQFGMAPTAVAGPDAHHQHHGAGSGPGREGISPADFVGVGDVRTALAATSGSWDIEVHEARERAVSGGAGAHHTQDIVLRARRLSTPVGSDGGHG
jgi:SAM-dependent methyltransferase